MLGEISRPKGLSSILTSLWEDSYSPRKGHIYDVAFVEWRMSGRTKKQAGEESAEVLWVATIINSSRALGFDMSLELEFLDEKEFRITKDRAQGYLFPKTEDDRELSRETKLRGSFWVPLNLAKQIKRTEGVWRATPR